MWHILLHMTMEVNKNQPVPVRVRMPKPKKERAGIMRLTASLNLTTVP